MIEAAGFRPMTVFVSHIAATGLAGAEELVGATLRLCRCDGVVATADWR